jgi:alkylhydroperoxidase family enzyme
VPTRYDDKIDRLRDAAQLGRPELAGAHDYVQKVRRGAYAVTDRDVAQLRAAGLSEDEIFEQTVAVAVEVGLARLNAALRTLR